MLTTIRKTSGNRFALNNLKLWLLGCATICLCSSCGTAQADDARVTLRFDRPAAIWEESFPLGNGRLGMMPDGGVARERIVLNEESMWSGCEHDTRNPDALAALPEIRQLLLEGRNAEAQRLMYRRFSCNRGSDHPAYGSYEVLGFLDLRFPGLDQARAEDYRRELSLRQGVAVTRFVADGTTYERRSFVSRAHDVAVVEIAADRPGAVDVIIGLSRPERGEVRIEEGALVLEGQLDSGDAEVEGVRYLARAEVRADGGSVSDSAGMLCIRGADRLRIAFGAATSYWGDDYRSRVARQLAAVEALPTAALQEAHTAAHSALFDRVELRLGADDAAVEALPTDERLARFAEGTDADFAALYFQFGRYLFISSTWEEGLPPNLQGIWANTIRTPWNGDYHLNINVEMNHWIAGVGNLDDLRRPLFDYTRRLVPSGEATARDFYGTGGWCAHVLANAWNFTAPAENPVWGATNTGGAWLALDLWDRYLFNRDEEYLRAAYPVLRGAADFFLENLVPTGEWLVTAPTSSPENGFYMEGVRHPVQICMGSTMDNQIVRALFGAVAEAAGLLGCDADYAEQLRATALRLPPNRIAEEGYLMEWLEDYREAEPQHRHVSHLFGLYPGAEITPVHTPELAAAARETLERRGDGGTGWSRAWKICFWARLGDGDRALKLLGSLLTPAVLPDGRHGSGTYPNLLCAHPPFQIDGNFGGAAGIAEMLVQSHDGAIDLLPALPAAWSEGSFRGLAARGGVEVDCTWRDGRAVSCTLRSARGGTFVLRAPGVEKPLTVLVAPGREERIKF